MRRLTLKGGGRNYKLQLSDVQEWFKTVEWACTPVVPSEMLDKVAWARLAEWCVRTWRRPGATRMTRGVRRGGQVGATLKELGILDDAPVAQDLVASL